MDSSFIILIFFSYLLGSVNFATIITHIKLGINVRELGDHNPGATNVYRNVDKKLGVLVAILDGLKGFIPLVFAKRVGAPDAVLLIAGAAVILGHDYSIFYHFNGGTGISTTIGSGLFFAPEEIFIPFLFVVAIMYFILYLKNKRDNNFLPLETGEAIAYICFLFLVFAPNISNKIKMFFLITTSIVVIRKFDVVQYLLGKRRKAFL